MGYNTSPDGCACQLACHWSVPSDRLIDRSINSFVRSFMRQASKLPLTRPNTHTHTPNTHHTGPDAHPQDRAVHPQQRDGVGAAGAGGHRGHQLPGQAVQHPRGGVRERAVPGRAAAVLRAADAGHGDLHGPPPRRPRGACARACEGIGWLGLGRFVVARSKTNPHTSSPHHAKPRGWSTCLTSTSGRPARTT
jgi:hypothetical protein